MNDDLFSRIGKSITGFFGKLFPWLFNEIRTDWIRLSILTLSATQTFYLFDQIRPTWAFWLPFAAVALMEVGTIFWIWRENVANDRTDAKGKVVHTQENIANAMIWTCLGTSGLTMIAGALLEITNSKLSEFLKVNPAITSFVGWVAIVAVFLLGLGEMVMDWQYRRADPELEMEKAHRGLKRELLRKRKETALRAENKVIDHANAYLDKKYARHSRVIGQRRAAEEFKRETADVFNKKRRASVRRKKRVVKK